jgi:Ankyrin repeats (3 copies)
LHNGADRGHVGIVSKLLDAGADVNAQLDGGMTALHYAAHNGHTEIVKLLLKKDDAELSLKDSSDRTPMLCAAERGHDEIVSLLAPEKNGHRLLHNAKESSQSFKATIVDFGINENPRIQRRISSSMYDLLYGWDKDTDKAKVPTQIKNIKVKPSFRWVHIPANNLAWVDAMLTKVFVESGHREVEDFKALEKCFNQEHRGPTVHASFMRTYAHRIPPMTNARNPMEPPPETIQEETITAAASTPAIQVSPATPLKGSLATLPDKENTPKSDKRKGKADRFEKKQAKKTGNQGPNPKANISKQGKQSDKSGIHSLKPSKFTQNGKIVLFVSKQQLTKRP